MPWRLCHVPIVMLEAIDYKVLAMRAFSVYIICVAAGATSQG